MEKIRCAWMLWSEPEEEEGLLSPEEKEEIAVFLAEVEEMEITEEELNEKW